MSIDNNFIPVRDRKSRKQINLEKRDSSVNLKSKPTDLNCISMWVNKGDGWGIVFIKFDETKLQMVKYASMWTDRLYGDNVYEEKPEAASLNVEGSDYRPEEYIQKLTLLIESENLNPYQLLVAEDLILLQKLFFKTKENFHREKIQVAADESGVWWELETYPE